MQTVQQQVDDLVLNLSKEFIAKIPGRSVYHVFCHSEYHNVGKLTTLCITSCFYYRKEQLSEWQAQNDVLCEQCLIELSGLYTPGYRTKFLRSCGKILEPTKSYRIDKAWKNVKPYFNCR